MAGSGNGCFRLSVWGRSFSGLEDIKRIAPNLITRVSWQPSPGQITDHDDDLHHLRALILIKFDGSCGPGRYRARSKRDLPPAELPV